MLALLFSMIGMNETRASHATGADLTYQFLGNGQYLVTFTLYRDCFGITAPTTQTLTLSSFSCNFPATTFTMQQTPNTGTEISTNCPAAISTCSGGTNPGIQQYQYQTTVTLPAPCADWQFRTSVSSRNAALTTILNSQNDNLYIDAFLNNTNGDNSSPTFSSVPIAFECIGQQNIFNHGVIDADGDSLVYSFIAPRTDPNTPLTYNPGFSVSSPLMSSPGVNINSVTGDITMNPTQADVAAVAVMILEYRNGVIIGSVMRDMQLYIVQCSNTLPILTGINGTTNYATSSCVGGQLCFDVISTDADPGDILSMTWNSGIPGATFTVTGGPTNPVGHFCWSPTANDARPNPYTFIVSIRDNACPSNGVATKSFSVTVSNMTVQITSTPSVQCFGSHNGSASATATGNPPLQFIWTLPSAIISAPSVSHLGGGSYTLNVIDGNGCVGTRYFNIVEPGPINVSATPTNAGCGGTFGSALASVSGGTPNFSYLWSPGGQTTANATSLTTGTYTVRVTDSHGCTTTASTPITSSTPVTFALNLTGATCLANNGTATVTHTGGTGSYSYAWTPDIPGNTTTAALTGLITGGLSVVATDLGTGCSQTLSGIIQNLAGISATISASAPSTCETGEDGSATVVASGGQPPYTYLWPNGDTTATTTHLAPGTYLARVEDYNGCRAYASVTIGFQFVAPVVSLGPDSMPCTGLPYTMDAGAGFNSYLWSDNSTNQSLTVYTSGTYSVLVTNAQGCQNFDAINVSFVSCMVRNNPTTHSATTPLAISIYPNPANNEVNVSIARLRDAEVKVILTDILGNVLIASSEKSQYGYSKKLDIHTYPSGVYLLKVQYNDEVTTERIIKQ